MSDDPLGLEGLRLGDSGRNDKSVGEIYVGPMQGGKFVVCMFTRGRATNMTFEESDLRSQGGPCSGCRAAAAGWKVRDLWAHSDNGTLAVGGRVEAAVPAADVVMFTLTPA